MLFTRNLLEQYITIDDTNKNIGNEFTLKSCEIEGIEERTIPKEVVFGLVKEITSHPEADKLVICQVDCGESGIVQICTAAENMIKDYYVPVALPGAYLPKLGFEIGTRKMRGEESNGMICAKEELGINEDTEIHGIWNMQSSTGDTNQSDDFSDITEADLGKPLTEKYPWLNDVIYDVDNKTLTHRPDMTGHLGLARELAAIYQTHFQGHITTQSFPSTATTIKPTSGETKVLSNNVPYYSLYKLKNIKIEKSDFQTRLSLIDMGVTPRNNWVDAGNLFMYMTGQPIHFFDADKVEGKITVRDAKDGEVFIDLFETEHILQSSDIVITDSKKIIALAGIIGSNNSGITQETTNIIAEVGNFHPIVGRRTATRLGLRTDAIMRYEKNINPLFTKRASAYLVERINDHFGIQEITCISSYEVEAIHPIQFPIRREHINTHIRGHNHDYGKKIGSKILHGLGCATKDIDDMQTMVTIPQRRSPKDLTIQADIAEEIVRIYGFEKIEPQGIWQKQKETKVEPAVGLQQSVEELVNKKFNCDFVETYPWAHINTMNTFDIDTTQLIELENSLSPETSYMSPSLIFNLLDIVKKNHKFFDTIRIATTGDVYAKKDHTIQQVFALHGNINTNTNIHESKHLGIVLYKKEQATNWENDLLLDAKEIVKHITRTHHIDTIQLEPTSNICFHPKQQAIVSVPSSEVAGASIKIGYIGKIHPVILKQMKLPETAQLVFANIDLPSLSQVSLIQNKKETIYATLQDQILTRDLSFVIERTMTFESVIHAIQGTPGVESVKIFDLYQGERLPEDKKSIALEITIHGEGKTTTEEINIVMDNAISQAQKTGAILRVDFEQA